MAGKTTVYMKPGCPYSRAAIQELKRQGVDFEEVDVIASPEALIAMLKKNGGRRAVPTIVTGDDVQVGFKGS